VTMQHRRYRARGPCRYLREPYRPLDYELSGRALGVATTRCLIRAPPVGATVDLPNQGEVMRVWTRMRAGSLVLPVAAAAAIGVPAGGHN